MRFPAESGRSSGPRGPTTVGGGDDGGTLGEGLSAMYTPLSDGREGLPPRFTRSGLPSSGQLGVSCAPSSSSFPLPVGEGCALWFRRISGVGLRSFFDLGGDGRCSGSSLSLAESIIGNGDFLRTGGGDSGGDATCRGRRGRERGRDTARVRNFGCRTNDNNFMVVLFFEAKPIIRPKRRRRHSTRLRVSDCNGGVIPREYDAFEGCRGGGKRHVPSPCMRKRTPYGAVVTHLATRENCGAKPHSLTSLFGRCERVNV